MSQPTLTDLQARESALADRVSELNRLITQEPTASKRDAMVIERLKTEGALSAASYAVETKRRELAQAEHERRVKEYQQKLVAFTPDCLLARFLERAKQAATLQAELAKLGKAADADTKELEQQLLDVQRFAAESGEMVPSHLTKPASTWRALASALLRETPASGSGATELTPKERCVHALGAWLGCPTHDWQNSPACMAATQLARRGFDYDAQLEALRRGDWDDRKRAVEAAR